MFTILAIGIVAYLVYRGNALGYFDKFTSEKTVPVSVSTKFYPCVIEGSVDGSPMGDRVKALAIEAEAKGMKITGDYVADYTAQGGEMHLTGHGFKFTFDSNGQIVANQSYVNLFAVDYPCEGGMTPDGILGMAVDVGGAKVGVKGRVIDGKFVDGEVRKGWMPHIYGVLSGTWRQL
jgi:hypothetical protein